MNSWNEKNTLGVLREAEEVETFEYPKWDTNKGPMIKKVENIYRSLLDLGKRLPKQISEETYLEAKRAIKALYIESQRKNPTDTKLGFHRTEDGEFPENGMFITFTNYSSKTYGLGKGKSTHGVFYGVFPSDTTIQDGESAGYAWRDILSICYVRGSELEVYGYYIPTGEISEPIHKDIESIYKWKEDSAKDLSKVPQDVLNKIERGALR